MQITVASDGLPCGRTAARSARLCAALTALLMLGIAGCGSVPPADLSTATFAPVQPARVHSAAMIVNVDRAAVSRRSYGSGSPNYQMPYELGHVEESYAKAVSNVVFANASFGATRTGSTPELRLVSFSHNLIAHSSGSMPDATDEVIARWALFDAGGTEIARYVFIGSHSAATGLGGRKIHYAKAQARGLAALDDLYRKTVAGLAEAPELAGLVDE